MSNVIELRPVGTAGSDKVREIFFCTSCGSRSFKIYRIDGEPTVDCANCEHNIDFDDLFNPDDDDDGDDGA